MHTMYATNCRLGHSDLYLDLGDGRIACRACKRMGLNPYVRRPPKLRVLPIPPRKDLIWAAGLFEGEGTIAILRPGYKTAKSGRYQGKVRPHIREVVTMANTDIEIVKFFSDRWGARPVPHRQSQLNARTLYQWQLSGPRAEWFVTDLLPHFQTQRTRRRAALFLESRQLLHDSDKSPEYHAKRQLLFAQMRVLNWRGKTPPSPIYDMGRDQRKRVTTAGSAKSLSSLVA